MEGKETMKILVINGPNLNMLGIREPEIYGDKTLLDLNAYVEKYAQKKDVAVSFFQSNFEGEIIEKIQQADPFFDGIIINPAAFTHYSYAILDALKSISKPAVEVHLSNINKREDFRKHSVTKEGCIDQITGLGFDSYLRGLDALIIHLKA
jgi:3-dehydroquinate dehydratase II